MGGGVLVSTTCEGGAWAASQGAATWQVERGSKEGLAHAHPHPTVLGDSDQTPQQAWEFYHPISCPVTQLGREHHMGHAFRSVCSGQSSICSNAPG